jgi:two-component system, NarL family, response regulator NreC
VSIQVLVADDHQIIRHGLRLLFSTAPGMEIVGEAESGKQALELAAQLRPDVVVMDVSMPDLDGLEATRALAVSQPELKVIALSMHNDRVFVEGMRSAGAAGYVLKDAAFEDLADAIRAVMRGETFYNL